MEQHLLQIKPLRRRKHWIINCSHVKKHSVVPHSKSTHIYLSKSQPLQFDNCTDPYCGVNFILITCAALPHGVEHIMFISNMFPKYFPCYWPVKQIALPQTQHHWLSHCYRVGLVRSQFSNKQNIVLMLPQNHRFYTFQGNQPTKSIT